MSQVLLGWPGAQWAAVQSGLASGQLPNLAALLARGSCGPLAGFAPFRSTLLWRTVATGLDPELQSLPGTPSLWDRFAAVGKSAFALGWPDAELPASLTAGLAELTLSPAQVDAGLLALFIPRIREIDLSVDPLPRQLMVLLAELYTVHNQAAALLAENRPDFLAVRWELLERIQGWGALKDERYRDLIPNAIRVFDALLGDLLRSGPPDLDVVVVSAVDTRLITGSPLGLWAAAGPSFQSGIRTRQARVADVAPTVLATAGLGVGADSCGRVLKETLSPNILTARGWSATSGRADSTLSAVPSANWDIGIGLLDLGFAPRALPYLQLCFLNEPENPQHAYDYARCLQQLGLRQHAIEPTVALQDHGTSSPRLALMQAQLAVTSGRYAEALPLARQALREPDLQADAANLEGTALLGLRRFAELAPLVDQALATDPEHPLAWTGRAYLRFVEHDWPAAAAAARRALELRPSIPLAQALLARVSRRLSGAASLPSWHELTEQAKQRTQWTEQIATREQSLGLMAQSTGWQVRPPSPAEQQRIVRSLPQLSAQPGTPETLAVIVAGRLPRLVGAALLRIRPNAAPLLELFVRPPWEAHPAAAELVAFAVKAAAQRDFASLENQCDHSSPLYPMLTAAGFAPLQELEIYDATIAAGLETIAPYQGRLRRHPVEITALADGHVPIVAQLCHELGLLDPARVYLAGDPVRREGLDPRFSFLAGSVSNPDGLILCRVVNGRLYLEVLAKNPRRHAPLIAAALMQAAFTAATECGLTHIFSIVNVKERLAPAAQLFQRARGHTIRRRSLLALQHRP